MNKIAIQVISDLHLEFHTSYPKFKPLAKYLFLAGDIYSYSQEKDKKIREFFGYCSSNWEKIFYVLGNHEYYQSDVMPHRKKSIEELEIIFQEICNTFGNVYLLNNSYKEIVPGVNVYGTTFWTSRYGYPYYVDITQKLNDYVMIATKSEKTEYNVLLKTEYIDALSDKQLNLMKEYLKNENKKTIMMTHFPPIRDDVSNPRYDNNTPELKNYFSWNNIHTTLDNKENIIGWVSGHTHWSYDVIKDDIRFISNQTGYIREYLEGKTKFAPDTVFEFDV